MSCRYGATPDHRVRVELVEADLESAFSLVDMLESTPTASARLIADAEDIYQDTLSRLSRLDPTDRAHFAPLVTELRRAIDRARA